VKGEITDKRNMKVVAHRCKGEKCFPPAEPGAVCPEPNRKWSEVKDWDRNPEAFGDASLRKDTPLPQEGETFTIPLGWNMEYDLEDSPIFDTIEILGCLHFKEEEGKTFTLRAKKIWIKGGELYMGTYKSKDMKELQPYNGNAVIHLHGTRNEPTLALQDQGLEAGSKIIANLGRLKLIGKKRSFKMTRLTAPAKIGDSTITVETKDVDLVKGDRIAIPPTDLAYDNGETRDVVEYNKDTGVITLDKPLEKYHFGAEKSTAEKYSGVDMRGEILSLSRNIKIIGEEVDKWGCQILTSDVM
jgi:hypothetical protein